jgi:DNA-binding response OmpR family regulator
MQALIVEDSAIVAKILRARLERADFQVSVAANASEGWLMFQATRPQLVTLDIVMPTVDGLDAFSLLTRIRNGASNTAVFIVSASSSLDDRDRFMQAGAMGFLSKPFIDFEKLRGQLLKLFPLSVRPNPDPPSVLPEGFGYRG